MSKIASAVIMDLAKNIRVSKLDHLWQLIGDENLGPCEILAEIAGGKTVDIPGELSLYSDGRLTIYAPFVSDGPSPRGKVKYRGKTFMTVGTPLGPYMKGTKLRATARASIVHDRICRSVEALAAATGKTVQEIYEISDRKFRKDLSEDWCKAAGTFYYKILRAEAAVGHPYRRKHK